MIEGRSVAALIPARAGSKGLPGKNTRDIAGRPLIAWSILAGLGSHAVDQVIVTSDSPRALSVAEEFGATPLERPPNLAGDSVPTSDVIRHVLERGLACDIVVLLQPTSPNRTAQHIDQALSQLPPDGGLAVVSVCETHVLPELMYRLSPDGLLSPVIPPSELRRQDAPLTYVLNGAIYAAFVDDLSRCEYKFTELPMIPFIMSEADSIDIDDAKDFEAARVLLEGRLSRPESGS